MSVTTIVQNTEVDSVGSVVLTDISSYLGVDDNNVPTTFFTRAIQVYGPPDPVSGNLVLQFTLQLTATSQAAIELMPPSNFILAM
jgi:hypothetical protein